MKTSGHLTLTIYNIQSSSCLNFSMELKNKDAYNLQASLVLFIPKSNLKYTFMSLKLLTKVEFKIC